MLAFKMITLLVIFLMMFPIGSSIFRALLLGTSDKEYSRLQALWSDWA